MGTVWGLGLIIGPAMGGYLSQVSCNISHEKYIEFISSFASTKQPGYALEIHDLPGVLVFTQLQDGSYT